MRISDWSSDVCSSDLHEAAERHRRKETDDAERHQRLAPALVRLARPMRRGEHPEPIGRASGRGRVCQYVSISEGAVSFTKKNYKSLMTSTYHHTIYMIVTKTT